MFNLSYSSVINGRSHEAACSIISLLPLNLDYSAWSCSSRSYHTSAWGLEQVAKEILPGWFVAVFCVCFHVCLFFSFYFSPPPPRPRVSSPVQHIHFMRCSQNYGLSLTFYNHTCRPHACLRLGLYMWPLCLCECPMRRTCFSWGMPSSVLFSCPHGWDGT